MLLTIVGGFLMLMGTLGMLYPRIIKRIKMKKSQAEYYEKKFKNDTPENDIRKTTREVIFGSILVVGSIMVIISYFLD